MMQILKGTESSLNSYMRRLHEREPESLVIWPVSTNGGQTYYPANGHLRSFLAQLRPHLGDEQFTRVINRHRVAASFLFDRLYDQLSADEKQEYLRLRADIFSSTSHNWYVIRPLILKWSNMFNELLSLKETHLIIPNILKTKGSFVGVLFRILIDFKPQTLKVTLGYDSSDIHAVIDKNGIRWDDFSNHSLLNDLTLLSSHPVQHLMADDTDDRSFDVTDTLFIDELDSNKDGLLFELIDRKHLSPDSIEEYVSTLEWIFGVYDFTSSLQFSLKLLAHIQSMSHIQRFVINMAAAVSAHNRQFDSEKGDNRFNIFLESHLRQALDHAEDSIARTTAAYRLAVTLARREKQPDAAIVLINDSLAELSQLPESRLRSYREAWLFNIRAYAHSVKKNKQQAAWDVEKAFQLADEGWGNNSNATTDEVYTLNVFATNRATLAQYEHDNENIMGWLEKGTDVLEKYRDVGKRFFRYHKMRPLKEQLDLRSAIIAAEEGLADALYEQSAEYQDLYLVNLAELHYRIGDLRSTIQYATRALHLYGKIGETDRRLPVTMLLAAAEMRSGNYAAADSLYQQGASIVSTSSAALVDILSIRATLAARQKASDVCETLLSDAIKVAVASGERNTMLLVARRAGEAFSLLGQREQALAAYQQALDVASVMPATDTPKAPSSDMARIWIGLFELECKLEQLQRALAEIPVALWEDADFWWEIPRVLKIMSGSTLKEMECANPLGTGVLLQAASQRADSSERLYALKASSQEQPAVREAESFAMNSLLTS